ncbi:hypothetical protein APHAL10511_004216 [Amanita phalloides]|nr:hypothetical protein APHAL10511_004216 [Amanita phalloides]
MVKPILPRQSTVAAASQATDATAATIDEAPQPRRRGRKPGPLSRSAREAQRKLNHSIIEKARRTKINEALTALRQLVPPDYAKRRDQDSTSAGKQQGESSNGDENDEYDDDDDGDGEYGTPQRKAVVANKQDASGKKEEKEFKLEVLERTVAYLQDLAERYEGLYKEHEQLLLSVRRCRYHEEETSLRKRGRSDAESPSNSADTGSQTDKRPFKRHEPLPSISSLLSLSPDSTLYAMDVLPSGSRHVPAPLLPPYLPTPPSSARFRPTQTPASPMSTTSTKSSHIPSLSLGPTALPLPSSTTQSIHEGNKRRHSISQSSTSSNDGARPYIKPQRVEASPAFPSSPSRTREDETAASLLLTLRSPTSPRHPSATSPLLHMSSAGSRRQSISHTTSPPPSLALPLPERLTISETLRKSDCGREFASPAYVVGGNNVNGAQQVETPGSLLGLTLYKNRN